MQYDYLTFVKNSFPKDKKNIIKIFIVLVLTLSLIHQAPVVSHAKDDIQNNESSKTQYQWVEIMDPQDKAKVFDLIYQSCQSNYDKIDTWKAQYEINTYTQINKENGLQDFSKYKMNTQGVVDFIIDFLHDDLSWKYICITTATSDKANPQIPLAIPSAQINDIEKAISFHTIYNTNMAYVRQTLLPMSGQLQNIPNYEIIDKNIVYAFAREDYLPSNYSQKGDPRFFFSPCRGKGGAKWVPYWGSFSGISSNLLGLKGDETKQRINSFFHVFQCNSKNEILYKISVMKKDGTPFDEQIFSSSAGFNIISTTQFIAPNQPGIAFYWQYTLSKDIYIPDTYTVFHSPNDTIIHYRLKDSDMNLSLTKKAFDIKSLGINDGDLILNFQEKVNYIIKEGKMVVLCQFNQEPTIFKENNNNSDAIIIKFCLFICGTSLIVFGIVMKIKYLKKKKIEGKSCNN